MRGTGSVVDLQCVVLIVEDDKGMRDLLHDEISEAGYGVVAVPNLSLAVQTLHLQAPDIVVADQRLPDGQGASLLEYCQRMRLPPAFVILTGFGSIREAVHALKQGADDFLTKPLDLEHLKARLRRLEEVQRLRKILLKEARHPTYQGLVAHSSAMRQLLDEVQMMSGSEGSALIVGESGVGKEKVARAIHDGSSRSTGPFVPINCAALPEALIESELFGHVKGSFTGAQQDRKGIFEEGRGGTILLDEVTELPLGTQAKLLRVLQEGRTKPVGANREREVDVRVLATTNREPTDAVSSGTFREDLYYRLETFLVRVPPLRERREDISALVAYFLERTGAKTGRPVIGVSSEALDALREYDFPGNVRELENLVERMVTFCRTEEVALRDLPRRVVDSYSQSVASDHTIKEIVRSDDLPTMESLKRSYARYVLDRFDGNKRRTALALGVGRKTLYRYLEPTTEQAPESDT